MSLSDIVNVSITRETVSVSQVGFGTPLILGPNANFNARVQYFSDLLSLADALVGGTSNPEYQAGAAAFAQNPHPERVAVGHVIGQKVITDDAGTYTAGNVKATVNGSLIDESYDTDKDTTLTNLAASIQALDDVSTAVYTSGSHTIIITPVSGKVLAVSVDVTGITGTMTMVVSAVGTESLDDALDDIRIESDDWYGLVITSRVLQDQKDVADWTEVNDKIFGCASSDANIIDQAVGVDTTTIVYYLKSNALVRSFAFYHQTADGSSNDDYIESALFGKILPFDPGSYTAMFKTLAAVAVSTLSTTQSKNARDKNCNVYELIGGVNITREGKVGEGEYIDIIIFIDWLKARITENVYSLLVNQKKVPYTSAGIVAIESRINQVLKTGQNRNGISPEHYDEQDAQDGGFFTEVPAISDISPTDKANRILNDVKFTAWLAGAIHAVVIKGIVTL